MDIRHMNKYLGEIMWAHNIPLDMTPLEYIWTLMKRDNDRGSLEKVLRDEDAEVVFYISCFKRTSIVDPQVSLRSIEQADQIFQGERFDSCIRDGKWSARVYREVKDRAEWQMVSGRNSFVMNILPFYFYHMAAGVLKVEPQDIPEFQSLIEHFSKKYGEKEWEFALECVFDNRTSTVHVWSSTPLAKHSNLLPSRIMGEIAQMNEKGFIMEVDKPQDAWEAFKMSIHLEKTIEAAQVPARPRGRL